VVDASYWKNYRVELNVPESTDQAVFHFFITGPGQLWLDQIHMRPKGEGNVSQDVLDRMATMHIPILRFPGGCFSTNYHWKFGIGPVHLRPAVRDESCKLPAYYDFGTDEYLDLCLKQKITPMITINIGSGTPDEAGEWAAYIAEFYRRHGQEPPLAYFQMGNEHYGTWESAHMTGAMYAAALREYIPAVRANYPNARIVALGEKEFQTLRKSEDHAWRDRVLEVVEELGIDVIVINRYKGQWNDSDLDKQINVVDSVTKVQRDFEELIGDCRKKGLSTKIGITEWNYWMRASAYDGRRFTEDYDVSHAQYISGMIHLFARMAADMELATFYHLINPMGIIQHYTADVVETCIVELFRMYRPAFPGDFVPLRVESPKLGETESAVDAICLRQTAGDWVFLSNRHPTQSAQVDLSGFGGRKAADVMMLSGDSPLGQLLAAEAPQLKDGHLTLPPLSVLRVRFES
jgi:alpha-L-arabinofuranosidase